MKNTTEKSTSIKKIILFGAGLNGKKALEKYGKEKVAYFCDNNINLINTYIDGVLVISYRKLVSLLKTYPDKYSVIVTPVNNWTICRHNLYKSCY